MLLLSLLCLVWFFRGFSLEDVLPDQGHDDDVIVDPHTDNQDHQSKGLAKQMLIIVLKMFFPLTAVHTK